MCLTSFLATQQVSILNMHSGYDVHVILPSSTQGQLSNYHCTHLQPCGERTSLQHNQLGHIRTCSASTAPVSIVQRIGRLSSGSDIWRPSQFSRSEITS